MPDTMRFAVDPLPGGSAAVGEEVSFREDGGRLLALNEDGEPFGAVPGRFAALLAGDVRAGTVEAEVSSREDGRPVVSVAFGEAPAPGDGDRADAGGGQVVAAGPQQPGPAEPVPSPMAESAQPAPGGGFAGAAAGIKKEDADREWTCPTCGATCTGKFCRECGARRPEPEPSAPEPEPEQGAWTGARHLGASQEASGGRSAALADEAVAGAHASRAGAGDASGSGSEPPDGGGGPSPLGEYHRKKDSRTRNAVIAAVVAVVAVVAIVLAVTFWPCSHEWAEATCTEPATCTKCGETEGEALGHDWQDATCTEPETCSRCGETQGEALGHDVEDWTVDVEATCSEEGSRHGTCTVCGEEVTESIAKTDHTEGEWTVVEEATVLSDGTVVPGEKQLTCSVCGEVMDTQEVTIEVTVSQQNALESALDYLDLFAFSYEGLVDQLEYEGFSTEDATFAADYCGADWNEEAVESAESYLELFSFSRSELVDQLEYEGFTSDQAEYAADAVGM